ncbi:hypothetical protein SLEP1_g37594 [Rubroshorea leprosula]|uniref:Uncharacterized protein n=1 Tax=Rubroshorea leprosula TaxID=152421 RepID=A0AAV5KV78_9ROSI|nr:hypothetical protein SLEP1_g37594 [Rubroshorea leprosula]
MLDPNSLLHEAGIGTLREPPGDQNRRPVPPSSSSRR